MLPGAFSGYRWKALKSVRYSNEEYGDEQYDRVELETERDSLGF